jgi:hypothetical protein
MRLKWCGLKKQKTSLFPFANFSKDEMYQIIDDTDTKITTLSMTISENQNY